MKSYMSNNLPEEEEKVPNSGQYVEENSVSDSVNISSHNIKSSGFPLRRGRMSIDHENFS